MSDSDGPPPWVRDLYHVARLRIAAIRHIARKNPRVPVRYPVSSFSIHAYGGQPAILA